MFSMFVSGFAACGAIVAIVNGNIPLLLLQTFISGVNLLIALRNK